MDPILILLFGLLGVLILPGLIATLGELLAPGQEAHHRHRDLPATHDTGSLR